MNLRSILTCLSSLALLAHVSPVAAQPAAPAGTEAAKPVPVTIEAYYRIKWGEDREFIALFKKNHLPILEEAKARGLVVNITIDMPYAHMVGGARWDLRVATTYRDAQAALFTDPAWTAVFDEAEARLKKANPRFDEEEVKRFTLLEEHWDVVIYPR